MLFFLAHSAGVCRIHQLHLCKVGKTPLMSVLDIKPTDGKSLVLELLGTWRITSLPLLSGPLWPGIVALDRVLSMSQIELLDI